MSFGAGSKGTIGRVLIPMMPSPGILHRVAVWIVDNDKPLPLSRAAMIKMGMDLILTRNSIVIPGQEVPCKVTTTGHQVLPIINHKHE